MHWCERQHQSSAKYMTCLFFLICRSVYKQFMSILILFLSFLPPVSSFSFPSPLLAISPFLTTPPSFLFHSFSPLPLPLPLPLSSCSFLPLPSFPPAFHLARSPPHEYQHFIIQQGFTGTLWNHLFHGSLIEYDTSHTSNSGGSDSFSLSLSLEVSPLLSSLCTFVVVSCFRLFTLASRSAVKTQAPHRSQSTDAYKADQNPHWVITSVTKSRDRHC